MKKTFMLLLATFLTVGAWAAPVQVISNKVVAKGYYPRLNAAATELTYLSSESMSYAKQAEAEEIYVTTENLKMVLYTHGERKVLDPRGNDANYLWVSLSPDKTKVLYKSYGKVGVCDLNGKELYTLGNYNDPVWYGNDYVVAALEENDGHYFTGGSVVILSLDGQLRQELTAKTEIGMDPSVSYQTGQIAYSDFEGNIHLMQINLAGQAIQKRALPAIREVEGVQPKPIRRVQNATKANFSDFKIYINPGHGGYDGDDRGMKGWFNETTQGYIFWESQSNLDKGLQLKKWLDELGFQTFISRTLNRTEDDRNLNEIAKEASEWGADFMLSIHTNAGGPSNFVLQLHVGWDEGDTHTYPTMPKEEHCIISRNLTTIMGNNQYSNKIATWSHTPQIRGDKTFARKTMGWSDGYGVLRKLRCPGTISEGAMHDYYPETHRLMNMDYKHQEAWNFMKTFCTYFLNYELPKGVVAGQVRDAFLKQVFPNIKRIKGSRDEQNPLNKAKVELLQNGAVIKTYVTDTCYNGVFFFWDLEPGTYTLRTNMEHYYNQEVELEVKANEITYHDFMVNQKRETPPVITSYSPLVADITDSIEVSTPIIINFNWDMWTEPTLKAFSITPAIEGTLELTNAQHTLVFTPKPVFAKATEYTVTLSTEACHADTMFNNHLQEDFVLKFRTKNRGKMTVTQTYPAEGATDVSLTPTIFALTDGEIKSTTLTNKQLTLKDTTGAAVSISARALKKNTVPKPYGSFSFDITSELKPNMVYTLTVAETVSDINNVVLKDPFVLHFTTGSGEETAPVGDVLNELDSAFFAVDAEKTVGMKSRKLMTSTNKRTSGKASNSIEYEFNGVDSDEALFLKPLDLSYRFHHGDTIALDVYGDLSYNTLYAEFLADGEQKLIPICVLDYSGFQSQDICLDELLEGIEYNFTGIKIAKSDNVLSQKGLIYLDGLRRVCVNHGETTDLDDVNLYDQGIQKVVENDQVIIVKDGVRYNVLGTVIE